MRALKKMDLYGWLSLISYCLLKWDLENKKASSPLHQFNDFNIIFFRWEMNYA